jgi:hypothetical protein
MTRFIAPFSAPLDVETYQDAVERLRSLEERARGIIAGIKRSGLDLVRVRYDQGHLADMALRMRNARMEDLAEQVNVGPKTLYDAHLVYRRFKSRVELERQIRLWEEEGREVSWSMVRNHARNRLPDEPAKAASVLQEKATRLEKKTQRLEADALDLQEQAERMRTVNGHAPVDPDLADELEGVAVQAQIVAGDTRRQAAELRLPKPERQQDERYLAYVRQHSCLACGATGAVQAHHLDRGGTGSKGPDYTAVPLCATCHGHLHEVGVKTFWGGFDPWRRALELVLSYPPVKAVLP